MPLFYKKIGSLIYSKQQNGRRSTHGPNVYVAHQNEKNRSVATAGPQARKKFSNRILATDRISAWLATGRESSGAAPVLLRTPGYKYILRRRGTPPTPTWRRPPIPSCSSSSLPLPCSRQPCSPRPQPMQMSRSSGGGRVASLPAGHATRSCPRALRRLRRAPRPRRSATRRCRGWRRRAPTS
jgi:hypothetical protein